ncbi:TetR/AcrR family transcriptional regulator [Kribbella antibiotica]|nr:TetR/AcrR family transcriptional regulator [Kribbella antibiotica]
MAEVEQPRSPRLSVQDWEAAALEAIATGGLRAVAVEPLARVLGVTKGSFYAHFRNRRELVDAALRNWERSHGAEGLAEFAAISDPKERLRQVLVGAIAFSQSARPSPHLSLLAEMDDETVRAAVHRVNESRVQLIADAYRELGMPRAQARRRAQLAYAAYLGLLQLARSEPDKIVSGAELNKMIDEALVALLPVRTAQDGG